MGWDVYCPRRGLGCIKQGVQRGLSLCANLVLHVISFLSLSCLGTLIFSSVLLQRRDRSLAGQGTEPRADVALHKLPLGCEIEENRKLKQVSRWERKRGIFCGI